MSKRATQTLMWIGILGLLVNSARAQPAAINTTVATATRIDKALDKETTFQFLETPLSEMVDYVSRLHSIDVGLDRKALDNVGLGSDAPITASIRGISLRSALRLVLRDIELTFVIRDGTLLFTTREEAESSLINKVYPVSDLLQKKQSGEFDYDSLTETIKNAIDAQGWDAVGGPGTIDGVLGNLVVSQTMQRHREIHQFLTTYRDVIAELKKNEGKFPTTFSSTATSAGRAKIQAALDGKMTVEFLDTPLSEIVDYFTNLANIPISIDSVALNDIGLGTDTPLTLASKDRRFQDILRRLLTPKGLVFMIRDETLQITTAEVAESELEVRFFPIDDLTTGGDVEKAMQYDRIIEVITSSVARDSWDEVGGPGTIDVLAPGVLVSSQLSQNHDSIAQLLTTLRKQGVQPKIDPNAMIRRVYRLFEPALIKNAALRPVSPESAESLVAKLPTLLPSQDWRAKGAVAQAVGSSLIVTTTHRNHREIEKLLTDLGLYRRHHFGFGGGAQGGMFGSRRIDGAIVAENSRN